VRLPAVVPGDVVRYSVAHRRGRRVEGVVEELLSPSAERIAPSCPWSASCGGCDLDMINPAARRAALSEVARRALRLDEPPTMVAPPRDTDGRARITLHLDDGKVGYRRRRSHELVPVDDCEIARPEVRGAIAQLRHWLATAPSHGLRQVEIRSDGSRVVYHFRSDGRPAAEVRRGLATLKHVALDGKRIYGDPTLTLAIAGHRLRASPSSFYQVHLEQNAALVAHVVDLFRRAQATRVLDLYAGNGNFSIPLAAAIGPVIAVEGEGSSIRDLEAMRGELPIVAIRSRVERFDPSTHAFDGALLDPPRTGATGVLKRLANNRPRAIVYVACNVVTAARDLREIGDYVIEDVRCFDLFPKTHHFETVVYARRPG